MNHVIWAMKFLICAIICDLQKTNTMLVDILMKQMQVKDHQNPTNLTIHKIYENYSNAWTNKKSQYCAIQS
jgi:hypothetical protein